jgi:hypothetical protein
MERKDILPALLRPGMYAGAQGDRHWFEWVADAVAAYLTPSAEAAQPVALKRYGLMFMNGTPYIGEKPNGRYVEYNDVAALSQPQGELREALDAKIRERIRVFLLVRESARADDYPWAQLNDATDIFRAIDAALAGRTAG